jgi:integration host factor subunit beta
LRGEAAAWEAALTRAALAASNPHTGETVQVHDKTVPYFKAGTEMLRRLNGHGMKPSHTATTTPAPAETSGTA